ncbi:MAG: sigma 54-interacting transcriptional regulator [Anaerolineales bacterium]|nr:sigma 54-interacting transcriptional regulator [Anaerolineales bacterium]MCB9126567.1 sigma 54-interacting transcriptional regulator [Ardenticatenales bacterium]MCB9172507.1 sigma 54-interacting transcriptional regulator [Ardenticatenales bacterium]
MKPRTAALPSATLRQRQRHVRRLLEVARPVMEDIYQWIQGSNSLLILADRSGCILDLLGDPTMIGHAATVGWHGGAQWSEGNAGTNAIALSLREASPVQVTGEEHFLDALHGFSEAAAPIFTPYGDLLGCIALVTHRHQAHPYALSTMSGGAQAVMNQLSADLYLSESNARLTELNTLFTSITEGVVAWNEGGFVTHINQRAGRWLSVQPATAAGRPLSEILALPQDIQQKLDDQRPVTDYEFTISQNGQGQRFVLTIHPISAPLSQGSGHIATLQPVEVARRFVHHQVGAAVTHTLEDIHGRSHAIERVKRSAIVAARGTGPLLLRGERGVHLDRIAQAVHHLQHGPQAPFVALHCAALMPEMQAVELLGYERNSFADSPDSRPSKFELADGGTLFLSEVEQLGATARAALLQILHTGTVCRLGSHRPMTVEVRVIATTHQELDKLLISGDFPRDLYHALNTFAIHLPPLRERADDLPAIIEDILASLSDRLKGARFTLQAEAIDALCRYPWPGNEQELASLLERAATRAVAGQITLEMLPQPVRERWVLSPHNGHPHPIRSMEEAERHAIEQAGWGCDWQISQMAERLGISRTTLWRKMKQFRIDREKSASPRHVSK